ncbi:MAG TPA: OmpA family protein [Candidatus Sulfotelmatobacter sp.]|nr:OmpA family protein [Candidatus Sulfotelmatobacter sp.]
MRTRALALALVIMGALAACETAGPAAPGAASPTGASPFHARTDETSARNTGLDAGDRVFFAFDSAALEGDAPAVLQRQADWMRGHPDTVFMLAGNTDDRGTREYNLALGARRADAVRSYLVGLGIESGRLKVTSYGKERPAVVGATEEARALNRRVETMMDE